MSYADKVLGLSSGKGYRSRPSKRPRELNYADLVTCGFCRGSGKDVCGGTCGVCKGNKHVKVKPPVVRCLECHGSGHGKGALTCLACRGIGVVSVPEGAGVCSHCHGTGEEGVFYCKQCRGQGIC